MDDKKKKTEIEGAAVVVILLLIVAVFPQLLSYLWAIVKPIVQPLNHVDWAHFLTNIDGVIEFLIGLSIPVSLFFLIGIVYCVERLKVIRVKEAEKHDVKTVPAYEEVKAAAGGDLPSRWKKVGDMLGSANPNDWKQAILEADNMLDLVLSGLGYRGEGVGEKLKRVEPSEMKAVNDAWEAHKVRNQIAHEGSFQLSHHDANEVIQRYRRVFEEFYYI